MITLKKGDIVIIASIVLLIVISAVFIFTGGNVGEKVIVSKNNETVFEGKLRENKTVDLESNVIEIKNGKVWVRNADCNNQICVNHKAISKKGESIVCLPNKVLVEIK